MTDQFVIEWLDEDDSDVTILPPDLFLEFEGAPIYVSGGGGGAGHIQFSQLAPAATWTWVHNLNSRPAVMLFLDSDLTEPVITDVSYPDLNTVVIEWPSPETGKAYI